MTRITRQAGHAVLALAMVAALGRESGAQTAPPSQTNKQAQRPAGGRGTLRAGGAGGEMNVPELQSLVDGWAIVEARRRLELSDEQYATFVAKFSNLQNARRRHMMARQRLLRDLNAAAFNASDARPADSVFTDKVKAFDDQAVTAAQELRQLALEVDNVLSPYQRARFRLFEEQVERKKLDFLAQSRQGRGAAPPPAPAPGKGGK
jgi:hypothetical protein